MLIVREGYTCDVYNILVFVQIMRHIFLQNDKWTPPQTPFVSGAEGDSPQIPFSSVQLGSDAPLINSAGGVGVAEPWPRQSLGFAWANARRGFSPGPGLGLAQAQPRPRPGPRPSLGLAWAQV